MSFKTEGTLWKTLKLHPREQIAQFGAVLTLRVVRKRLGKGEKGRVGRADLSAPPT